MHPPCLSGRVLTDVEFEACHAGSRVETVGWTSAEVFFMTCSSSRALNLILLVLTLHARRVEIVDWDGQVLRSFGLDECEGAPHDARIVRRSSLVGALRSAIPAHLIRYGVSVADVHTHEQGTLVCPAILVGCCCPGTCVKIAPLTRVVTARRSMPRMACGASEACLVVISGPRETVQPRDTCTVAAVWCPTCDVGVM